MPAGDRGSRIAAGGHRDLHVGCWFGTRIEILPLNRGRLQVGHLVSTTSPDFESAQEDKGSSVDRPRSEPTAALPARRCRLMTPLADIRLTWGAGA